ncbi:hypothetical protein IWZ01DRAFT_485138 [Phyllosticta capitalensis]
MYPTCKRIVIVSALRLACLSASLSLSPSNRQGAATTTNSDSKERHSITRNFDLSSGPERLQKNWTIGTAEATRHRAQLGRPGSMKESTKVALVACGIVPYQADRNGRAKNPPRAECPFTIKVDPDI